MENIEKHFPLVWSIARSFSRESSEDSDAYAEGLFWLWEALKTYDPSKGKQSTWIYPIVKNGILIWKRKRSNARLSFDDCEETLESIEERESCYPAKDVETLRKAVMSIEDPRLRDIGVLRMAGHSWEAIGKHCYCSASTVKDHFQRRILPRLQESFGALSS